MSYEYYEQIGRTAIELRKLEYDPHHHYGKGKFCQLCRRVKSDGIHTGGANDHYEEQQHEASHFVPTDGETDTERNL